MVALGLGKFYGSSLPRMHFYTDVKFNDERVDPPSSVTDPFMAWAEEAHWSMGGLNFKRNRFQGRIEGNIERLRAYRDQKSAKASPAIKQRQVDFEMAIHPKACISPTKIRLGSRILGK